MPRPDITGVLSGTGERLAAARIEAGFTQEAAARELDVSLKTIQRWEAVGRDGGGNLPSTADQCRLAELYRREVWELVPRTDSEAEIASRLAEADDILQRAGGGCS